MSNLYRKFSNNGEPAIPEAVNQQDGNQHNMKTENQIEVIEEIYASYINGSFTQAKDQIAEALEDHLPVIDLVEEITSEVGGHGRFRLFVAKAVAKYITTASEEAKLAVLDW